VPAADSALDVDLGGLIPTLDNVASELASQQRDSLTQRKELAEKTKAFRRMDDAGKLAEVKGLLKGACALPSTYDAYLRLTALKPTRLISTW
jgi:hypothetical protein